MNGEKVTGHIRPIVVCVFRNGNRILVGDGYDSRKREAFYRPPGGGIQFGERSEVALHREMAEELGVEIERPKLLGVLENLFTFDGEEAHEVVFVYDAQLKDKSLYEVVSFRGSESDGSSFDARWIEVDSVGPNSPPVYPNGLTELLKKGQEPGQAAPWTAAGAGD